MIFSVSVIVPYPGHQWKQRQVQSFQLRCSHLLRAGLLRGRQVFEACLVSAIVTWFDHIISGTSGMDNKRDVTHLEWTMWVSDGSLYFSQGHDDDWEHITINFIRNGDGSYVQDSVTWCLLPTAFCFMYPVLCPLPPAPYPISPASFPLFPTFLYPVQVPAQWLVHQGQYCTEPWCICGKGNLHIDNKQFKEFIWDLKVYAWIVYSYSCWYLSYQQVAHGSYDNWCDGVGFVWDYDYCAGGCGYWDDFRSSSSGNVQSSTLSSFQEWWR